MNFRGLKEFFEYLKDKEIQENEKPMNNVWAYFGPQPCSNDPAQWPVLARLAQASVARTTRPVVAGVARLLLAAWMTRSGVVVATSFRGRRRMHWQGEESVEHTTQ
jgi:hypothetical protein